MSDPWQCLIGSLSGAISVVASAYGAHGLKSSSNDKTMSSYGKAFDAGARMHLYHSIILTATPAITTSIVISVGIVLCGCAMLHNIVVWQRVSEYLKKKSFSIF